MILDMEPRALSPDVSAIIFNGRFVLGNKLSEVEHTVRQRIQNGMRNLVLDFSGVNYIDSAGIGVVAFCINSMKQAGGKLAIAGATGQVRQLMKLTHLDQIVGIYPDISSAHGALGGPTAPPPA